jgi:hypothetical protein
MTNPFDDDLYKNDLIIQMVATKKYMIFRDGIDAFNRSYNISWDSVNVYGRQDSIQTYQATGEVINLTWPLKPGTDPETFDEQLRAILALGKFVRPQYNTEVLKSESGIELGRRSSIIEAPLLYIRYRNLIVEEYSPDGLGTKLLIAPSSLSVDYGDRAREVEVGNRGKLIVPKRIVISLSGAVINTEPKYYSPESTVVVPDEDSSGTGGQDTDQQAGNEKNIIGQ